ncbi:MAG: arabinan endo-1,5-alpha-L-arabinosidase [Acidobacteriaceae bacterium]|nr:arabinan endo-1,5-alpha-L-arabinosidase [Acidobacteriaceae bacterium]MBV9306648.1 arabinan endo-1,5-alpha-L-arabinosidase [Acidobacteriaceae bacterium]
MRIGAVLLLAVLSLAGLSTPELLKLDGDITPVHDPVIIKERDTYYVFCTGGAIRSSKDLHYWTLAGRVFDGDKLPDWTRQEVPGSKGGYWAPDISVYKGTYRLYYAVSTFGKNDSVIGLATNKTLDRNSPNYRWIDEGLVFRSHHDDDFNAIDPNLITDAEGRQWLDFGSFWGGIKMRRIDPATGKLSSEDTKLYSLASRPHAPHEADAIEAPFIVHHGSFYYLFASFDFCCRGARSSYYTVVGRSRQITGPYLDADGRFMTEGGGTRVTMPTSLWRGPGHEGLLLQRSGPDLMVFHTYDAVTGKPYLQISTVSWENEWPYIAPLPGV